MSPASYRHAPPRVASRHAPGARNTFQIAPNRPGRLLQEVQRPRHLGARLVVEVDVPAELAVLERLIGGGEVALRPLEKRVRLAHVALLLVVPVPVAGVGAGVALVRRGWGGGADHVLDGVDERVADP